MSDVQVSPCAEAHLAVPVSQAATAEILPQLACGARFLVTRPAQAHLPRHLARLARLANPHHCAVTMQAVCRHQPVRVSGLLKHVTHPPRPTRQRRGTRVPANTQFRCVTHPSSPQQQMPSYHTHCCEAHAIPAEAFLQQLAKARTPSSGPAFVLPGGARASLGGSAAGTAIFAHRVSNTAQPSTGAASELRLSASRENPTCQVARYRFDGACFLSCTGSNSCVSTQSVRAAGIGGVDGCKWRRRRRPRSPERPTWRRHHSCHHQQVPWSR